MLRFFILMFSNTLLLLTILGIPSIYATNQTITFVEPIEGKCPQDYKLWKVTDNTTSFKACAPSSEDVRCGWGSSDTKCEKEGPVKKSGGPCISGEPGCPEAPETPKNPPVEPTEFPKPDELSDTPTNLTIR
jgi:hypothetical protein